MTSETNLQGSCACMSATVYSGFLNNLWICWTPQIDPWRPSQYSWDREIILWIWHIAALSDLCNLQSAWNPQQISLPSAYHPQQIRRQVSLSWQLWCCCLASEPDLRHFLEIKNNTIFLSCLDNLLKLVRGSRENVFSSFLPMPYTISTKKESILI